MRRFAIAISFILLIPVINHISIVGSGQTQTTPQVISENLMQVPDLSFKEMIAENIAYADLNGDKIADNLNINQEFIDAILMFEDFSYVPQSLAAFNLEILKTLNNIPIVNIKLPSSMLKTIASLPGLAIIEENIKLESHLAYSTSQFGVRPYIWDLGYTGSSSTNIAVIDSGIDYTHPSVANKIIASYNFINNNATDSSDDVGHGTFVSHIIAGALDTDQTFTQSTRGTLPPNGYAYYDIVIANLNETTDITMEIDWGNLGNDNPSGTVYYGLQKYNRLTNQYETACGNCIVTDGSGLDQTTFSSISPGDYFVVIGNNNGAQGKPYELKVTIPHDSSVPSQIKEDGYYEFSGVSPSSNIVALKVTDNSDSGTVLTFLDAMDWVIDNHETYNITVVNLSVGILQYSSVMDSTVASLTQEGVIVVVAAGNEGKNSGGLGSPASAEEAITVGAINRFNEIAFYSSNGANQNHINLVKPDVVAPGGSQASPGFGHDTSYEPGAGLIVAADANGLGYNIAEDELIGYQGTSFAAPHIAGLALLMVEKLIDEGTWIKNQNSVFKVKRAILAGTFEVANIGSDGGEGIDNISYPNQSPSLNRISKDYVEGWGAVNARAAFNALSENIGINQIHNVTFGLEDPFVSNVFAWNYNFEAGVDYTFIATVPEGADIDLLVFEANGGQYGDLNLLASSTEGLGIDEELTLNFPNTIKGILVARLVDSINQYDESLIQLYFPNFTPDVEILSPSNGSYVSSPSFALQYSSQSSEVELFIDEISKGIIQKGHLISGLSEGIHNITIKEENLILNSFDVSTSIITVDLTNPTLNSSDFQNLNGQTIDGIISIEFDVSDNIRLNKIEILVDNIVGARLILDGISLISNISLNPTNFRTGLQTAILKIYDYSGRSSEISITIQLDHQIYLIPHFYIEIDGDTGNPMIEWEEFAANPLNYSIVVNSSIAESGLWNGNNIQLNSSDFELGYYEVTLVIYDQSLQKAEDSFILLIFDGSKPRLSSSTSPLADANFLYTLKFEIDEKYPSNYTLYRESTIIDIISNVDSQFFEVSVDLENKPGNVETIKLFFSDTSFNTEEFSIMITWVDNVIPEVTKSDDLTIEYGKASEPISWSWVETYPESIIILLDDELYNQVSDLSQGEFSISSGQLNSLDLGPHEYRLRITDLGGNVVSSRIYVQVNSSQGGNDGFIGINMTIVFISLTITVSVLKRERIS